MNKKRGVFIAAIVIMIALLITTVVVFKEGFRKASQERKISKRQPAPGETTATLSSRLWLTMDLPTLVKDSETIIRGRVLQVLPSIEGPVPKIVFGEKASEEARTTMKGEPYIVVREDISKEELQKLDSS